MNNNRFYPIKKALTCLLLVSMFLQQTGIVVHAENYSFTDHADEQSEAEAVQEGVPEQQPEDNSVNSTEEIRSGKLVEQEDLPEDDLFTGIIEDDQNVQHEESAAAAGADQPEEVSVQEGHSLIMRIVDEEGVTFGEKYEGIELPEFNGILDLSGASPYEGEVTRVVPVEGTKRLYLDTYSYTGTFLADGQEIRALKAVPVYEESDESDVIAESPVDKGIELLFDMQQEETADAGDVPKDIVYSYSKDGETFTEFTEDAELVLHYALSYKKTKYVYSDRNIRVEASVEDPNAIPDDAVLSVTPIMEETNKAAFDAYIAALNDNAEKIASQSAQGSVSEYSAANTLLYDIAFLVQKTDEDGNILPGEFVEVKPSGDAVSISMKFKNGQLSKELKAENTEDIQIVHLPVSDTLIADVDTTQEIIEGSSQDLYSHEEMVDNITAEVIEVQDAKLDSTENVSFEAEDFSAYAVTLEASDNFNLDVTVNFLDDDGNPIPTDTYSLDKRYYLVAYVPGQVDKGWGFVDCDYVYEQEINPNGNPYYSMTIDANILSSFRAYYWGGVQSENLLSGSYNGKTIYIQVTETDSRGITANNYKSTEIGNGQKMGDYTLRMTGQTSFSLTWASNATIDIDAVMSGYKYEVQAFEADGVTPINTCGFDDTYYVIAHEASDDDKYFVEELNTESLNGGKQTGTISSFKGKYYIGNVSEYARGDSVVVELVSSKNMFENPDQYKVYEAAYFPKGSYPEGKFKVESVIVNPENTKTTIKLVKTPEYNYEVKVKTLQGGETTGDPSGLNLKVMAHSNLVEQNEGYYYASSNLSLDGNDEGTLPWLDDSSVRLVNSDVTTVEDLSGSPEKYEDGDTVAERYTMGVSVDDANKLVTITLTELPKYYVKNNLEKINVDTSIDTGKFYIYTDMDNADGTHSYYLEKWDNIPETGYQAGEGSDAVSENPRPYTTDKTVSVILLKSDEGLTLGEDGVIGNYFELTEGQLTDGFMVSYSEEKPNDADHSMTVTLTELDEHQHTFGTDPRWLWRFIDGKVYAEAAYSCSCGETETVAASVVKSADNESTVTYTAKDKYDNSNSRSFNKTFTVTYKGESTEYAYGATCRLTAEEASDWTVAPAAGGSGVVRAVGTKTFYFPVTENVTVTAVASAAAQQSAKIEVSSCEGGTKQFTYKVFWSLPEGAQVKSTMIYRSRDDSAQIKTAEDLLKASSLRSFDMKLNVRNGEFKYSAVNLTSGSRQTVMAQVVYSLKGQTYTIHTDPVSIAIQ